MNLSEPFIRRPVMTTMVVMGILLFGMMAYRKLPVSDLPNVDYPTVSVSASLPGASAETMASAVATVLEKQFSTISGLDSMNSVSAQGSSQITLQFNLSRDIDAAAQDVQAALARSSRRLPADMPSPPSFRKVNPADAPILMIALTSPTLPLSEMNEYGEELIAQRISMVNGVAQVQVFGSQKYAVRIQLDPLALAARGIGLDEVSKAIDAGNVNLPSGILYGCDRAFTIQAEGQLMRAGEYRKLIVAYRNGLPVRLEELGRVLDSVENDKAAAWYCTAKSQDRSLFLAVFRQPGMNTVEVADNVNEVLKMLRSQVPASVSLHTVFDRSETIRNSNNDLQFTMLLTLVLVVLVIFIFLRNASATVIPSLALPMSIIGTFTVMYLLGFSLDNLSLMALTLALGFVVDDAIVMLENIVRHMEMGKERLQAALDGSKEIGFTIVSMTLSLAAVFIPVLFMGDIVGRIFREFGVTIGVAVIVSGIISLTLTPLLSSRYLKDPDVGRHGRIYAFTEKGFRAMRHFYDWTLSWALERRRAVLLFSLAVLVLAIGMFGIYRQGFLPSEDRGLIGITTETIEGISARSLMEHQQAVARAIQDDPNIEAFMSSAGGGPGSHGGNSGNMFVRLKPRSERELNADQVIEELRPKLMSVPGIKAFPRNPPSIPLGGQSSRSLYQYTLQGTDMDELYRCAAALQQRMRDIKEIRDISSDMQLKNPELEIKINRELASSLGVSSFQVEDALYNAYGSRQVSTIFAPNNQYAVLMEFLPEYQDKPEVLSLLYVRSSSGKLVPISAIAEMKQSVGPLTVNHFGQLPAVTISFNLAKDVSLGQAVDKLRAVSAEVVPPGISTTFQGIAQVFGSAMKGMLLLLVLAIIVIYMVLAILYENFFHPVTILSALPFAGVGALLTLFLFDVELSIFAYVGIIMLVGLVKKNGIMMVDFAIELQRSGKNPVQAIHEACMIRFRPIMMTTMAALMAGIPIALGLGAGGEARQPLGLAVVGGLLFSQTLTLYVTPVFYLYMEKLQEIIRHRRERKAA